MENISGSIREAVETILSVCAGLKPGEKLLVAFDSEDKRVDSIALSAREHGASVTTSRISGEITREPPSSISSKMLENDVTLFCVSEQRTLLWGHADAKVAACNNGSRVLFLTQPLEDTPNAQELSMMKARSNRLGDLLENVSKIKLITGPDKELEIDLAKRKSLRLSSILTAPGSWGAVPDYSEAAVAPLETGSNGKLRVNGMIVGIGKVDAPVDLSFESGKLIEIEGGKVAREFKKLLSNYDESTRVLCELGFGTNHLRRDVRGEFDDKKALGSIHIALGDNHTFGGLNRSTLHIDCLMVAPKVYFDGELLDLNLL